MNMTTKPTGTEAVVSLEKVLGDQLRLYEEYANLVAHDPALMARLNIEELEKNNKAKGTLLLKIQAMDECRKNFVKQIALAFNLHEERVTIADICRVVAPLSAQRLTEMRQKLHNTIDRLKKLQESTSTLANASLGWINGSMIALQSMLNPSATYNGQGRVAHPDAFTGRRVEKQV